MPGVRLETLALRVVPQLQGVVQRGRQDVLSVGREFNKRHRRIVIVDERLETLAACRVPDTTQSIVTRRHNQRSVPIEMHGGDRIGMGWEGLETLSRPHVPDAHRLVERPRNDQIALRVKVAAEHIVGVAFQRLQTLAGAEFPNLERLVIAGRHQEPTIAGPGHIANSELVTGNGLLELAVVGSPNFNQFIRS